MKTRGQNGFTLYELLITMLIIGIVLAWGVPNLGGFARSSRISGTTNDLHGSFLLARSEAARAKENITICASQDGATCSGTFADGWIIFIDLAPVGVRTQADEHILKIFAAVDDAIHINTNGTSNFTFAPSGLGAGGTPLIAMICDARGNIVAPGGNSAARRIVVTPIGRSTIIRDQKTIQDSIDNPGLNPVVSC